MAYCFGDSFDLYAAPLDAYANGYWDSGAPLFTLTAGRFTGQCLRSSSTGVWLAKSSGINDAVHHLVCAFQQSSAALSGTTLGMYLQLSDGATNQCCIVFRSDGAILLTSATPAGTVLATYTGAVTLLAQWFAFEFEVVIHPTAGRFRVRKNNSTSDDYDSGATLNTRPGANSYANKLSLGASANVIFHSIDDLLWRSDASSVPFVGDVRCYVRMPASDASAVFSRAPSLVTQNILTFGTTSGGGYSVYTPFTPTIDGTLASMAVSVNAALTGTVKLALFADASNNPGAVLTSANTLTNPAVGFNTTTFSTPPTVVRGTQYWIGVMPSVSATFNASGSGTVGRYTNSTSSPSYAAFPVANPSPMINNNGIVLQATITPINNCSFVNEAQQDSAATYVYSSNVGDTDFYNIASIGVTPASTVAVTTRAFVIKSDAGSRSGKVLLKSGGTVVDSGSAPLSTTWAQMYRTDTVDPATGTAWTAVGVNAAQIGVTVAS